MSELELQDAILRHALELQRLSAGHEAEADAIMRELARELRQLLVTLDAESATAKSVRELIAEADRVTAAHYSRIAGTVDVHELVLVVADKTVATLQDALPRAAAPSPSRLASLAKDILIDGSPARAWWTRQAEDLTFKFAAAVRQGVLLAETMEQIVTRVVGRRGEPGIMDVARRNVRTLVHSSVMTAANRARLETFRASMDEDDALLWLSTLDGRTCPTCMALDGAQWDRDGKPVGQNTFDFKVPPAHFGCRCVISIKPGMSALRKLVPDLDERLGPGTRASQFGPTTATTFEEFLRRQSPEFVEEALGKKRAEMWLAGKLSLRDLVSGAGRELTLEELKAR